MASKTLAQSLMLLHSLTIITIPEVRRLTIVHGVLSITFLTLLDSSYSAMWGTEESITEFLQMCGVGGQWVVASHARTEASRTEGPAFPFSLHVTLSLNTARVHWNWGASLFCCVVMLGICRLCMILGCFRDNKLKDYMEILQSKQTQVYCIFVHISVCCFQ